MAASGCLTFRAVSRLKEGVAADAVLRTKGI